MRIKVPAVFLVIVVFVIAACGHRNAFTLRGTIQDGGNDSILVVGLDSRFERTDTIRCNRGQFKWSFNPDTVTTLILILPDGRRQPVFAEKGVVSTLFIPSDNSQTKLSGGYCNDSYQSFYLASFQDTCVEQAAARIDSMITQDPFNEITPYLIYDQLVLKYHAEQSVIEKLVSRMSGNMQDAPFLVSLKAEFSESPSASAPTLYNLFDSAGVRHQFANIGDLSEKLLVLVWSSWHDEGLLARQEMAKLRNRYVDYRFSVIDVSIDVNRDRWVEAISKDSLSWVSYNDPKGWYSRIVSTAKIKKVPVYVLYNESRRVIFKTDNRFELDQELSRVLTKKDSPRIDSDKPLKFRTVYD